MNDSARSDATGTSEAHAPSKTPHTRKELGWLSLGALGVVYGDIGTSPLYALKECFGEVNPHRANAADPESVLGVLSLVFWSLVAIVCVKYLAVVLRADNKGEGGTMSLAALVQQKLKANRNQIAFPILLALFGAGLLYGEGLITPAISVLSAVEGLSEKSPSLSYLVIPISISILIGLFWVQRYGTGRIGAVFGWVMLVWFIAIGIAGIPAIVRNPGVVAAISPHHAIGFLFTHGINGFLLLGSVVLCVTGCEALYADMGHFGKTPIRISWGTIVMPGLLLNYFGQGALYLEDGAHISLIKATNQQLLGLFGQGGPRLYDGVSVTNPFYALVDGPLLIPMIILATMAAVIASQALISGAFSLTNQAVQLGYLPRVTVVHTSHKHEGQIYIPEVNYVFMIACVALVLAFKTSSNLAAAYGIAVTGLMMITSYLIFLVCRRNWGWSMGAALGLYLPLVVIDGAYFSSNVVKVAAGGWFPLAIAVGLFAIMTTWFRGRVELSKTMEMGTIPDDLFLTDIAETPLPRVSGTAVFMTSGTDGIPNVLLHHVKHNKVLHKQVVLLSVTTENIPFAVGSSALAVRDLGQGFYRVLARVGFMQQPNVPRILDRCSKKGLTTTPSDTTYYLGRQTLLTTGKSKVARWRKMLFSFLARNSRPPSAFFNLPPNRVVELGLQIEL